MTLTRVSNGAERSATGLAYPSLLLVLVSAGLALVQFRMILLVLGDGIAESSVASHGVVIGRPHWRVFQNRILGPYILELFNSVAGSDRAAYAAYAMVMLTILGILAYLLGRQIAGRMGGTITFTVCQLGFAALLTPPWLYAWDFLDIIVFVLFVTFVAARKPVAWFVGLFVVAIFNRESAQFIALWLVIDPLARYAVDRWERRPPSALDYQSIVYGVCLLAAGSLVTEMLRSALLIEEVAPRLFGLTPSGDTMRFVIRRILTNVYWVRRSFSEPTTHAVVVIPLFLMATLVIAAVMAAKRPRQFLGLSLVHVAMVAALFALGNLPEARIYLGLIPFLALACVTFAEGSSP